MIQIERGDVVATKEGKTVRVLTVFMQGDTLTKIEAIDDSEPCPMRRPVFANQIARVLKKAVKDETVAPAGVAPVVAAPVSAPVVASNNEDKVKKVGFGRPAAQKAGA